MTQEVEIYKSRMNGLKRLDGYEEFLSFLPEHGLMHIGIYNSCDVHEAIISKTRAFNAITDSITDNEVVTHFWIDPSEKTVRYGIGQDFYTIPTEQKVAALGAILYRGASYVHETYSHIFIPNSFSSFRLQHRSNHSINREDVLNVLNKVYSK